MVVPLHAHVGVEDPYAVGTGSLRIFYSHKARRGDVALLVREGLAVPTPITRRMPLTHGLDRQVPLEVVPDLVRPKDVVLAGTRLLVWAG